MTTDNIDQLKSKIDQLEKMLVQDGECAVKLTRQLSTATDSVKVLREALDYVARFSRDHDEAKQSAQQALATTQPSQSSSLPYLKDKAVKGPIYLEPQPNDDSELLDWLDESLLANNEILNLYSQTDLRRAIRNAMKKGEK